MERAQRASPFCACGRPTRIVERDGSVWLECPALRPTSGGPFSRLAALLGPFEHTRSALVDLASPV
jgi:hypothetical protein